jgi:asparagine synthase (glutamine-hydrolysing)
MCGICGKIYLNNDRRVNESEIIRMRDTMVRRGPDDAGLYIQDNMAIGHRRLSIIDLEGSHQPLSNEDGTVWIVYNGEIYNFKALRNKMIKKGHKFKTGGDTEVIIHLYEEYGKSCVEELRGMFAFAIWDSKANSLFLARDRVGIKPLYYYCDSEVFLFASEIKSIHADQSYRKSKDIDVLAFHYYFSFLCVPEPMTIFKGIKKLLPGHTLILKNNNLILNKYWDVKFEDSEYKTEEDYSEKLTELLKEAVKVRLISDVPLGAFLSGGIDSSSVVAFMSQLVDVPLKTFSIGFSEQKYNEAEDAKLVADHFKTDHTEYILNTKDIINMLSEILLYFDEPFADASALPTYFVSKLAREKVTVILSGDGGDELFGGYIWHKRPMYQLIFNRLPIILKKNIRFISQFAPSGIKGSNYFKHIYKPYERYILNSKAVFNEEERSLLYSEELNHQLREIDPFHYNLKFLNRNNNGSWMNRIMEYDFKTYLPNDILQKVDRMSMFNSLEVRVPILDQKLVEFAAKMPAHLTVKNGVSKYIFKKSMENILPKQILYKRKQGFNLPLEFWMRSDLNSDVHETILGGMDHQYFDKGYVEKLLKTFFEGDNSSAYKVWELYVFQLWYQRVFKGEFAWI